LSRRISREHAMKLLYQFQVRSDDIQEQVEYYLSELEEDIAEIDKDYFLDVIYGVMNNLNDIDSHIRKHAKGWSVERMPKVDLAIMRLAVYELLFRKDIPWNVSINEAVELAKKYGGDRSSSFINGILGKVSAELHMVDGK